MIGQVSLGNGLADAPILGRSTGPGLGESARLAAAGVAGNALIHERELVQLTAYPDERWSGPGPARSARTRVRRPSRRPRSGWKPFSRRTRPSRQSSMK